MKKIIKLAGILLAAAALLGLTGCPGNVEKHEHTFAEEWTSDATHHWHAATCEHEDAVDGKAAHDFGEWSEGSRICLICEYEQTCEHTFGEWNEGKRVCSVCGYEQTCEHTFGEWNEGKRVCSVCGYEQTCEHTWDEGVVTKAPSLAAEGVKKYTCGVCQDTKTESIEKLPYNWYESPVDAETGLAATANSTYVYFGVFPRTVLPSNSTVTVDEDDKVEMGANKYYKGSDGEYYAKVLENAYSTRDQYKYENGEQAKQKSAGSYRYFKVEPIMWKVLTTTYDIDGKAGSATGALLLAEDILTANIPYFESTSDRAIDGKTVYASNYQHSQIRAYLNGLTYQGQSGEVAKWDGNGFLQTAFTATAQSKIVTTTVDNSGASTTDANGSLKKADGSNSSYPTDYTCADTADKIFLLSEKEVTIKAYGFARYDNSGEGTARIRKPTDYAMANYALQSSNDGCGGYWWLRSPHYFSSSYVWRVYNDGKADSYYNLNYTDYGVVPALCLSLQ